MHLPLHCFLPAEQTPEGSSALRDLRHLLLTHVSASPHLLLSLQGQGSVDLMQPLLQRF
jgi:hypothetical protein